MPRWFGHMEKIKWEEEMKTDETGKQHKSEIM